MGRDNTEVKRSNTLKNIDEENTGTFNISQYSNNLDDQKQFIKTKIDNTEIKLKNVDNKQETLNVMITRTALEIKDNSSQRNFQKRSQLEKVYQLQIESLSFLVEMGMKYEDLIYKYQKMLRDIENDKVTSYAKIKAAEKSVQNKEDADTTSDSIKLAKELHEFMNQAGKQIKNSSNEGNPMLEKAKERLEIKGY